MSSEWGCIENKYPDDDTKIEVVTSSAGLYLFVGKGETSVDEGLKFSLDEQSAESLISAIRTGISVKYSNQGEKQ